MKQIAFILLIFIVFMGEGIHAQQEDNRLGSRDDETVQTLVQRTLQALNQRTLQALNQPTLQASNIPTVQASKYPTIQASKSSGNQISAQAGKQAIARTFNQPVAQAAGQQGRIKPVRRADQLKEGEAKNLLLAHPIVHNLKVMVNLIRRDMVDLSGFQMVGVYHTGERYDYARSRRYLDTVEYEGPEIHLRAIRDSISPGEIYQNNRLTDDYRKMFRQSCGVIFFGGPDLPPRVYGEKTNLHTGIYDPYRHYFELSYVYHLLGGRRGETHEGWIASNPDYLIYGFCLGMQTMNVGTGGTMVQDIPSELYDLHYVEDIVELNRDKTHRNYYGRISMRDDLLSGAFHRVDFKSGDFAERLGMSGLTPLVYSNHHQAVDDIGKGFRVMATSMDGKVVEGVKHTKYKNVRGFQFHPEAPFLYDTTRHYRMGPDEAVFTGPQKLKQHQGWRFHQAFWQDFSERLQAGNE